MNKPYRPTPVTIVAVLQLVFGPMSLCGAVFALGAIFSGAMVIPAVPAGPGAGGPFDWNAEMDREAPGYNASMIWGNVAYVVLGLVMVFAGVALLGLWRGSRALNLTWAVIFILLSLAEVVYTFAVLLPASARVIDAQTPGSPIAMFCRLMHWTLIGNALYTAVLLAYPVAVLILLTRASVTEAFAAVGRPVREPEDREDDDPPRVLPVDPQREPGPSAPRPDERIRE
jgi:hypothetical protein